MAKLKEKNEPTPDRRPITKIQASRLAALTGVNIDEIVGSTVADLREKLKWRIDLDLLLFRRICGRVVKKDPVTGEERPVPFATVHVEDTDCSFLGFFPGEWPWSWLFPFFCNREEIATVVTDECGRFCVWVPRWEVDYILRFRHERFCFSDIFVKPSIRDLLEGLQNPIIIRPPKPEPDPPPFLLKDGGMTLRRAEELLGRNVAEKLAAIEAGATVGTSTVQQLQLLAQNGFFQPLPPPLPTEFKQLFGNETSAEKASTCSDVEATAKAMEAARVTLAMQLNLNIERLQGLNFQRFVGPFWRCVDVLIPEWVPIFDTPDITFRVTQDVDADGDDETIYSENFFDVRWNTGSIPDITLEASEIAVTGITCNVPEVTCNGEAPAIQFVGLMPLINPAVGDPYHEAATGYAKRPNRPHPNALLAHPLVHPLLATAPYTGTLQLYGCNHGEEAVYYRIRYSFNGAAAVPFTGLTWPLFRIVGGNLQKHWPVSDANGWYPIIPDAEGWFPNHLLLNWPTKQNGLYMVDMQLGNAAKNDIFTTPAIGFRVDNQNSSNPKAIFTGLAWRVAGTVGWTPLELICPVVERPLGAEIEFKVSYIASAEHLRSFDLVGGGCGGGTPQRLNTPDWSDPATPDFIAGVSQNPYEHWHTGQLDNSVARSAIFRLPASAPQGAYSFHLRVNSRAFNPSGGDGGFEADWYYDPVYNWVRPFLPVAVVNA